MGLRRLNSAINAIVQLEDFQNDRVDPQTRELAILAQEAIKHASKSRESVEPIKCALKELLNAPYFRSVNRMNWDENVERAYTAAGRVLKEWFVDRDFALDLEEAIANPKGNYETLAGKKKK